MDTRYESGRAMLETWGQSRETVRHLVEQIRDSELLLAEGAALAQDRGARIGSASGATADTVAMEAQAEDAKRALIRRLRAEIRRVTADSLYVDGFLMRRSPQERVIARERYKRGETWEVIARATKLSVATVKRRNAALCDALAHLLEAKNAV